MNDWEYEDPDDPLSTDTRRDGSVDTSPCPYCGKAVYEGAEVCPHCRSFIVDDDSPRRPRWVLITLIIMLLAIVLRWVFRWL